MIGRTWILTGIILASLGTAPPAMAETCTVDGAAAYAKAKERGWLFHCTRAVLETDRDGRIGWIAGYEFVLPPK